MKKRVNDPLIEDAYLLGYQRAIEDFIWEIRCTLMLSGAEPEAHIDLLNEIMPKVLKKIARKKPTIDL